MTVRVPGGSATGQAPPDAGPPDAEPPDAVPPDAEPPERHADAARVGRAALMVGALGVVYGDIGTSPLYSVKTVFAIDNGAVRPTAGDVYGVVSLIFWSVTLIVSIKYVVFVLRADNDGEGGVMAMAALVRRLLGGSTTRRVALVMALGVLGASLFYGDSVITPAISVLSAIEGLEVVSHNLVDVVVPLAAAILTLLFAAQRWGTHRVGNLFGPVMLLWFATLGVAGLGEVVPHPEILRGLSPSYAVAFLADRPFVAFVAMGAVVLSITGAEALYADMSHFGRSPIRRAWFVIVFPALTLNYLAQGALILRDPSARTNPFYLLVPGWAQIPMIVLATVATVIASQAVISGAFSVSRQALRLGFLPHLRIRHTSAHEGQVYVPSINWGLFAAVLAVTLIFRASARLATAYGVAVTGTFLITTALLLIVARRGWHWPTWRVVVLGVVFGAIELTYFAANLTKVAHGGWLTLLIALGVFTVMLTWQHGRVIVTARRHELEGPLPAFIDKCHAGAVTRVPGTAVFPHPSKDTTPLALRANLQLNHVLHERVVLLEGRTEHVPHVPWEERLTIDDLGDPTDGIVQITARFGFQDATDFPEVLRRAAALGTGELRGLDPDDASFFVSRINLRRTALPGMSTWRKVLFISLAHNAASQTEFLQLPDDRTVVMSSQVDL
jgi:KUP system potassium uptake protein